MDIKNKGDCMAEKLREQMAVDLQLRIAKPHTQKTYLREVDNLEKYHYQPLKGPEKTIEPRGKI
jgi:hypothetical protein